MITDASRETILALRASRMIWRVRNTKRYVCSNPNCPRAGTMGVVPPLVWRLDRWPWGRANRRDRFCSLDCLEPYLNIGGGLR